VVGKACANFLDCCADRLMFSWERKIHDSSCPALHNQARSSSPLFGRTSCKRAPQSPGKLANH
jgi:hypothetical protein